MRTLVTGGTRHLGRAVVALLQDEGRRVRLLARRPGTSTDVEWVQGDLGTGKGAMTAVAGVETVIHAATNSPAARRGGLRPLDFVRSPTSFPSTSGCRQSTRTISPSFVVACLGDGRRGEREDFVGPEALTMRELAEQYLAAGGLRRRIWKAPLPRRFTSALEAANTSAAGRRGTTMWAEWLQRSGAALPLSRAA